MWRRRLGLFVILCGLVLYPSAARANPLTVSTSLSLNFLNGQHDTGTQIERLNFTPLPLGDLDIHDGRTTLHLEGLPALTFGYGGGPGGHQETRLSIINATLRRSFAGGSFVGVGETIYNQRTFYPLPSDDNVASQGSRVTGLRVEAGIIRPAFGRTTFAFVFAVNPAMHGIERTKPQAPAAAPEILNPERAVQVDTSLRLATPVGRHGDVIYGLRYLNYASRFDLRGTTVDGLLADRNVGILPLVGYRVRF